MAFSAQQLDEHFKERKAAFGQGRTTVFQHPNYSIVYDYLTGNNSSLQGMVSDFVNQDFMTLVSLLQTIDPPGTEDKLLLDVITHPDVAPYVQHALSQWLVIHVVQTDSASGIAAAASLLQSMGWTNDDIFNLFVTHLNRALHLYVKREWQTSELKKFMLSITPAQPVQINYHAGLYWENKWNALHFQLIEEAQPHLIEDYIFSALTEGNNDIAAYLHSFQNGKYLPLILDRLKQRSKNTDDRRANFIASIRLYEVDNALYQSLVIASAKEYLDDIKANNRRENYYDNIRFHIIKGGNDVHLKLSAAAIYFFLQQDKEAIMEWVTSAFQSKAPVDFEVLQVLFYQLGKGALPFLTMGLAGNGDIYFYRKILSLLTKEFSSSEYIDELWKLTSAKSKPLREEVVKILVEKDSRAEEKAIPLLQSKNAETRQTAARILSFFSTETAVQAVIATLNTETNDNARDILLAIISHTLPEKADKSFVQDMIAAASHRGKLSKPVETWLLEEKMPALFYTNGQHLSMQEMRFLLYRMSRVKAMRSEREAKYLIVLLDKEKAAPFTSHILKLYIEKGARPEQKYLMALAALLGNDEMVNIFRSVINKWIDENRGKMAEYGIGALALQGSNKALRLVEWYSRKYRSKKANIGNAATEALTDAAEELGISIHELGDRIVPHFGFDGLFKHVVVNGEEYRAFVDNRFKLAFFNEDNKKLKALPAGTPREMKDEFTAMTKEMREVVKAQALRLEYYLIVQRKWTSEEWQAFYLSNPVMFVYATQLLWGKYDNESRLLDCFLCTEDTTLINIEDDEISLSETDSIGIVHPVQLDEAALQSWQQKFFDLSVESPFPQLNRKIMALPDGDKNKTIEHRFEGVQTINGSIKSTLEKSGWQKGDVLDAGYVDCFRLRNTEEDVIAILEVEGVFAGGYDFGSAQALGRLYFIDLKKDKNKWLSNPKNEEDERLVSFGKLNPIFYSEVMGSILSVKRQEKKEGETE